MHECYSGGIILVAANDVKEAFEIAAREVDQYFYRAKSDDATLRSTYYPFEGWQEFEHLSCDYTEPQVILEESYVE